MRFFRKNEINCLDGFRGLLAIWVFWFHTFILSPKTYKFSPFLSSFLSGGKLGVDGFFALSGFILSHVYHNQFSYYDDFCSFSYRSLKFLYFRYARIYPLHCLISLLWVDGMIIDFCSTIEYLFEITMTTPFFIRDSLVTPCNMISWTIINEFYAYYMFPLLNHLLIKLNKNNKTLINLLIIPLFYSFLIIIQNFFHYLDFNEITIDPFLEVHYINTTIFEFFTGMVLYRIYQKYPNKHHIYDIIVSFFIGLIIIISINFDYQHYHHYYSFIILIFPFFLAKMNNFLFFILNSTIFKFLGDISFGFYLSHYFWLIYFSKKVNLA